MRMIGCTLIIILLLSGFIEKAYSQEFIITGAGELNLDTDQITEEGRVTKYFGMNVNGSGEAFLRVSVGDQSAQKSYEFKENPTQLYSFIFDNDLADEIKVDFRRGVFGSVVFDILNQAGEIQDSTVFSVDVTLSKKNCKKHPSPRIKKCGRVDLSKANAKLRKVFVEKFIGSIRGPIVLEP